MTTTSSIKTIAVLCIAIFALVAYNYLGAWTGPTGTPPNNNVAAPLTIGVNNATSQHASGTIEVSRDLIGNRSVAINHMRSPKYCDELGTNCVNGNSLGGNEIVWLATPKVVYGPNTYKSGSVVNNTAILGSIGLPNNIIKVYVGGKTRAFSYNCNWNSEDLVCNTVSPRYSLGAPGDPFRPAAANLVGTNTGSRLCQHGSCPATDLFDDKVNAEWVSVPNGRLNVKGQCSANCGTSPGPNLSIEIGAYECKGKCAAVTP